MNMFIGWNYKQTIEYKQYSISTKGVTKLHITFMVTPNHKIQIKLICWLENTGNGQGIMQSLAISFCAPYTQICFGYTVAVSC